MMLMEDLNAACEALDKLERGEPCSWNGVGWDGDPENSFGRDCVYSKIMEDIDSLEE